MKNLYKEIRQRFEEAGIDSPDLDARLILKSVLKVSDADFISCSDIIVTPADREKIDSMVRRRLEGEPVSRILGIREFWGLPFKVTQDVLDPRPDTETIIEVTVRKFKDNPPRNILDLGTGSGCILIALLHEFPEAKGVGTDISQDALEVAGENAKTNNVLNRADFIWSNWGESVEESFDLIVSNPPYIQNQEITNLSKEVKNFDPILALDGGEDGLQAYKSIFTEIKILLNPDGAGLFEIGYDQQKDVVRLTEESGLLVKGIYADLAGNQRVVEISRGDK